MEYNEKQKQAINFNTGICNVVACPGSGKTSVIIERVCNLISNGLADFKNILILTFSNEAKENIKNKLMAIGYEKEDISNVHTFHSFGRNMLSEDDINFNNKNLISSDFEKYDVLYKAQKDIKCPSPPENYTMKDIIFYINLVKNNNIKEELDPIEYYKYDEDDDINETLSKIYYYYERQKEKMDKYDFEDMLIMCYEHLKNDYNLLRRIRRKYKYILVDEMQDVNKIQFDILKLLAGENGNLFMVGDYLQCIYGFRGSNSDYMLKPNEYWDDSTTINMNINYRCNQGIVDVANELSDNMIESKSDNYVHSVSNSTCDYVVPYHVYNDKESESFHLIQCIDDLIKCGYHYKDIAILSRSNSRLIPCESVFTKNNIPYLDKKTSCLFSNDIVKMIVAYVVLINNPDDDLAYHNVFYAPYSNVPIDVLNIAEKLYNVSKYSKFIALDRLANEYKSEATITKIENIKHLINVGYTSINDCINDVCDVILNEYEAFGNKKVLTKDIVEDVIESVKYISRDCHRFSEFTHSIKLKQDYLTNDDRVNMMTIHASKGLEFPVVFVIGLDGGRFPSIIARDEAEEWRLLYVAMTRAKERLYLSSSTGRESKFLRNVKAIDKQLIR